MGIEIESGFRMWSGEQIAALIQSVRVIPYTDPFVAGQLYKAMDGSVAVSLGPLPTGRFIMTSPVAGMDYVGPIFQVTFFDTSVLLSDVSASVAVNDGLGQLDAVLTSLGGGVFLLSTTIPAARVVLDAVITGGVRQTSTGIYYNLPFPTAMPAPVGVGAISSSITLAANASPMALGITSPVDYQYTSDQLTISVSAVPSVGTVTLADATPVTLGETLTGDQLTGLLFVPDTLGNYTFSYTVTDPASYTSTGSVAITVTAAP